MNKINTSFGVWVTFGFATGGALAYFEVWSEVSFQMIWTIALVVISLTALVVNASKLKRSDVLIFTLISLYLGIYFLYRSEASVEIMDQSYLVGLWVLMTAFIVGRRILDRNQILDLILISSISVLIINIVSVIFFADMDTRVIQATASLAIISAGYSFQQRAGTKLQVTSL